MCQMPARAQSGRAHDPHRLLAQVLFEKRQAHDVGSGHQANASERVDDIHDPHLRAGKTRWRLPLNGEHM